MVTSEQVKKARAGLKESQAAFGARFGVDQSTIHRWETDGIPERGVTAMAVERVLADLVEQRASSPEAEASAS